MVNVPDKWRGNIRGTVFNNQGGGWMVCYIEMNDPATVITQNDENKQDLKVRS